MSQVDQVPLLLSVLATWTPAVPLAWFWLVNLCCNVIGLGLAHKMSHTKINSSCVARTAYLQSLLSIA